MHHLCFVKAEVFFGRLSAHVRTDHDKPYPHKNTRPACKPSKPAGRCSPPLGRFDSFAASSAKRQKIARTARIGHFSPTDGGRSLVVIVRDGTIAQPSPTSGDQLELVLVSRFCFHAKAEARLQSFSPFLAAISRLEACFALRSVNGGHGDTTHVVFPALAGASRGL